MAEKRIWRDLEHHLYREYNALGSGVGGSTFCLLISGGADSLALLHACSRVLGASQAMAAKIMVLHFHHGDQGVAAEVKAFRDQSQDLVSQTAEALGFAVRIVKQPGVGLLSEDQARQFRYQELQRMGIEDPGLVFVFGHHQDDLLETRFLRLLRGTGPQGIGAMQIYKAPFWRPWLGVSRKELEVYLKDLGIQWLIDPNQEDLRSWLRSELFPLIEKKAPGSLGSLARSLDLLATEFSGSGPSLKTFLLPNQALSRGLMMGQSRDQQRALLAQYLYELGHRDYSRGQIDEILKRLDKTEIVHTFRVSGLDWEINAEQIRALPVLK